MSSGLGTLARCLDHLPIEKLWYRADTDDAGRLEHLIASTNVDTGALSWANGATAPLQRTRRVVARIETREAKLFVIPSTAPRTKYSWPSVASTSFGHELQCHRR
jgi:hypothetical protein